MNFGRLAVNLSSRRNVLFHPGHVPIIREAAFPCLSYSCQSSSCSTLISSNSVNGMQRWNSPIILRNQHLHLPYQRHNTIIIRSYLFLPVTWSEFKERFQRWIERTEERIVQVRLLDREFFIGDNKILSSESSQTLPPFRELLVGNHRKRPWKRWMGRKLKVRRAQLHRWKSKQEQRILDSSLSIKAMPLPLPKPNTTLSDMTVTSSNFTDWRNRYQGWKMRRKEQYENWKIRRKQQYQGWKLRRKEQYQGWKQRKQEQYQGWKSRREAQYQRWSDRRSRALARTRQILLQEYSEPEWFDNLGRPLTSRDSTGRFVNPWQSQSTNGIHSFGTIFRWRWQRFERELRQVGLLGMVANMLPWSQKLESTSPLLGQKIPPLPVPNDSDLQFTWIGHSTGLMHVGNDFTILLDPMFSARASPFQNTPIGVARDVPPAFTIEELVSHQKKNQQNAPLDYNRDNFGKFDICCFTHDHYDHMDENTTTELKDHVQMWVVPLGIADWLVNRCSIEKERIVELEWWEQLRVGKVGDTITIQDDTVEEDSLEDDLYGSPHNNYTSMTITCCPASHWAGRTMWDRNFRLWCSFAFSTRSYKFFFCGDTGYPETFPLFHQIGDALGPFDFCAIPIAAYEPEEMMKDAHVNPLEAVKIHNDLRSQHSVATHWGSFQLSEEPLDAPPRDLKQAIQQVEEHTGRKVNFTLLNHGETITIDSHANPATEYDIEKEEVLALPL